MTSPSAAAAATAAAVRDRGLGALYGLAIGDALGMPTQYLPRDVVIGLYGRLAGFEDGPEVNDISRGTPAGRVTDDTDQALIVARAVVAGDGTVDARSLVEELLAWQSRMLAGGSDGFLGPSTTKALQAVRDGVPVGESGRDGDTNGAAMRIAGVGVATRRRPLSVLVDRVVAACRVTHNTGVAIAGASAVAAAISCGLDGATTENAIDQAIRAARIGADRGAYTPGADVAQRIAWAVRLVQRAPDERQALDLVYGLIGTGVTTQETVPAALALVVRYPGDPWTVTLRAAGLGGDSDTVASIAGAVAGSLCGLSAFPADAVELVTQVNDLHLDALVTALLQVRDR